MYSLHIHVFFSCSIHEVQWTFENIILSSFLMCKKQKRAYKIPKTYKLNTWFNFIQPWKWMLSQHFISLPITAYFMPAPWYAPFTLHISKLHRHNQNLALLKHLSLVHFWEASWYHINSQGWTSVDNRTKFSCMNWLPCYNSTDFFISFHSSQLMLCYKTSQTL